MEWNDRYMSLFREATERYLINPHTPAERFYLPDEVEFLGSIGSSTAEFHRFITDYATLGNPSPSTALLVAAQRRSFFLTTQRGISGNAAAVKASSLPPETEELQGIPYLALIIRKAEAKLFGTLEKSLMFPDEKDRKFLSEHGAIHPADFLALVGAARGDRQRIVSTVLHAMRAAEAPAAPEPRPTAMPNLPQNIELPQQGELPLS